MRLDGPGAVSAARNPLAAWASTEGFYFLEVLALAGFAITWPVLDVFGRDPSTFISEGTGRAGIVVFALSIALLPALVLWFAAALTRLVGSFTRHVVQVVVLSGLLLLYLGSEISRATDWGLTLTWVISIAGAAAFGLLYNSRQFLRAFLHFASAGPLIFLFLFLFSSPASALLRSSTIATKPTSERSSVPIVWIVLDEFPTQSLLDDRADIDENLFPNFAQLARSGTWYRNNTTVNSFTDRAVPALLTGRYPPDGGAAPISSNYPDNAFTLFGTSHRVNALEPYTHLCPARICTSRDTSSVASSTMSLLSKAWGVWNGRLEGVRSSGAKPFSVDSERLLQSRREGFERFLKGVSSDDQGRPSFDFAHLILPHVPLDSLPDGERYRQQPDGFASAGWSTPDAARVALQRHLLQVRLADRYVGELIRTLRERRAFDRTLIVVGADHGASYQAGQQMRGMTEKNFAEVVYTPLFIKAPYQKVGGVDDRNTETIDVLPTVADLSGVEIPWRVDGISLAKPGPPRAAKQVEVGVHDIIKANRGRFYRFPGPLSLSRLLEPHVSVPEAPVQLRIFRIGRYGGMIGKDVGAFAADERSTVVGKLVNESVEYDPKSGWAPVYIRAHVSESGVPIALAVNDKIGAWFTSADTGQRVNVWGVVPPVLLRPGLNDVRLYEIAGKSSGPMLRAIQE